MKKLILAAVFGVVLFGFGFVAFTQAASDPIPGVDIIVRRDPGGIAITVKTGADGSYNLTGLTPGNYDINIPGQSVRSVTVGSDGKLSGVALESDPIPGVDVKLGVVNVGILPTSRLYFFKEWGRGLSRLFTFNATAKAELELKITNEKAAELQAVAKASSVNSPAGLEKALKNYANAQVRLNARLEKLKDNSENPNVAKLLKEVDEKTAKHAELLERVASKIANETVQTGDIADNAVLTSKTLDNARNNIQQTFTSSIEKEENVKQKTEEQIKRAEVTISKFEAKLAGIITGFAPLRPAEFKIVTLPTGGEGGQHRALINTTRSNIKNITIDGDTNVYEVGLPGTAISTTRSNIKRPSITIDGQDNNDTTSPPSLMGEPIAGVDVKLPNGGLAIDGDPIPGVDIYLGKNPGGSIVITQTDSNGSYRFTGLAPGKYDLSVDGKLVKTITVGANGTVSGKAVSRGDSSGDTDKPSISDQAQGGSLSSYLAVSKGHLDDAKIAFAEGKNGMAYGLARSAEVIAQNGLQRIVEILGNQSPEEKNKTKTTENETPKPTNRKPAANESRMENRQEKPAPIKPEPTSVEQKHKPAELESTITILNLSLNPSTSNQSVTFTATVTGGATPTGSVTFLLNDVTNLGSSELNERGVATITTSTLSVGTHTVTATYNGTGAHTGSTSLVIKQVINQSESGAMGPGSGSSSSSDGSNAGA